MSKNWFNDMLTFDKHYGFDISNFSKDKLEEFLEFRIKFLEEELTELKDNKDNPEEIVDALIDLIVVATGTLTLFQVDGDKAWDEVLIANLNKKVGIKSTRPNLTGLPDLIKPKDWTPPSHADNHGIFTKLAENNE